MSSASGDFVRATEWRRVREFATDAASRVTPTALVVEGEAGAGKSRLWRAALEVAGAGRSRRAPSSRSRAYTGLASTTAVDPQRLGDFAGRLGPEELMEINVALRAVLDLE